MAESPADDDDYAFTLYLTALACLVRDCGSDLDDAIDRACGNYGRLLLRPLPTEDLRATRRSSRPRQIMAEIEAKSGRGAIERASRPGGGVADLDDASAALVAALGRMASDAPARLALTPALALQYATRFVGYSGTRGPPQGGAGAGRRMPGVAGRQPGRDRRLPCHRRVDDPQQADDQRAALGHAQAAGNGGGATGEADAAVMAAEMGDAHIDPSDAETALSHLREVSTADSLDEELRVIASTLSSVAHLVIMRAGRVDEDLDRVADRLQSVASRESARHDRGG